MSKELEIKNKELALKTKEQAPKVKEPAPNNKEPCKKCPVLLEKHLEIKERERESDRQKSKLRETIFKMDQKVEALKAQGEKEKKRREWTAGMIFGLFWGAGAIIFVEMIICTFLNLFNVI